MKFYPKKPARIPFTQEGYERIVAEKAKLLAERPDAVINLRKAREMGDLSENGYYKAARARLSTLDARLRYIERLVRFGTVVESAGDGRVDIGSTVSVSDGTKEYVYTVVGGYESDPAKHTISTMSPLGKALFGKRIGDVVTVNAPARVIQYTIQKISV
jgi:transcription elongation factor GreA